MRYLSVSKSLVYLSPNFKLDLNAQHSEIYSGLAIRFELPAYVTRFELPGTCAYVTHIRIANQKV